MTGFGQTKPMRPAYLWWWSNPAYPTSKAGCKPALRQNELDLDSQHQLFLSLFAAGSLGASRCPCATLWQSTSTSPPFPPAAVQPFVFCGHPLWRGWPTPVPSSPVCPALPSGCAAPFPPSSRAGFQQGGSRWRGCGCWPGVPGDRFRRPNTSRGGWLRIPRRPPGRGAFPGTARVARARRYCLWEGPVRRASDPRATSAGAPPVV